MAGQGFIEASTIKFHENQNSGLQVVSYIQMAGLTEWSQWSSVWLQMPLKDAQEECGMCACAFLHV